MTLNQVIQKLESLALSHKQINHFFFGELTEWLANGDLKYPCCFAEINNSYISKADHQTKFNMSIWFLDLVDIDTDTSNNEIEAMSDLTSVAEDYSAMVNFSDYQDFWTINSDYQLQYFREKFEDLTIAVKLDITVGVDYTANRCQVPATGVIFEPGQPDDPSIRIETNLIYNYVYTASGNEGGSITIGSLAGKEILLVYKGDKKLTEATNNPSVDEYSYSKATGLFGFGNDFEQGQKLQIIYR